MFSRLANSSYPIWQDRVNERLLASLKLRGNARNDLTGRRALIYLSWHDDQLFRDGLIDRTLIDLLCLSLCYSFDLIEI